MSPFLLYRYIKKESERQGSDQAPSFFFLAFYFHLYLKSTPKIVLMLCSASWIPQSMNHLLSTLNVRQQENSLSDLCRSQCYCFSQTNHFPMWNEVWTLLIQSLKLSSRFSWQGHQERLAHRKHIQVLIRIELIMTTRLPPRLDTPFFFFFCTAHLALDHGFSGCKSPLTMHSCRIKGSFHTCSYLSAVLEFQKMSMEQLRSRAIVFCKLPTDLQTLACKSWKQLQAELLSKGLGILEKWTLMIWSNQL